MAATPPSLNLQSQFPSLPHHFDGPDTEYSANAIAAHEILTETYHCAYRTLQASDNDTHRLRLHSDKIVNRMLPILEAMEPEILNNEWMVASMETLAGLVLELEGTAAAIERRYALH